MHADRSTLRQFDHKEAASVRFALDRNLPTVSLNDALHDRQAQAAAFGAAAPASIESLKDVLWFC